MLSHRELYSRATRVAEAKENDLYGSLSRRIKEERNRQGLTQEQLAEIMEVPIDTVKRMEAGKSAKLETVYLTAIALDVPLSSLLPMQEAGKAARIRDAIALLEEMKD